MKTTILIISFSVLSNYTTYAQLTNAEVYNFEVGDVFQIKDWGDQPGYVLALDTVVEKIVAVDTIRYVIHGFSGEYGPPPLPSFQYFIDTLIVINLDAPASHFSSWSCLPPVDDTTYNSCSDTVFVHCASYDSTCFEPVMWTSVLRAGLGGPYYWMVDFSSGIEYNHELIYSNTTMWGECGAYEYMFVGLNETVLPTEKELIKIVDLNGKETPLVSNCILVFIYSDGSREKIFVLE